MDELLTRRAPKAARTTWDAESRTFEAIVSTFADVARLGFVERLSRAADDWDLARVDAPGGMPFLLAHDTFTPAAKVGRVLSVSVGKSEVRAKVQLSRSDAADALVRDMEDGIGVAISIGYRVPAWQLIEGGEEAPPIRLARKIELYEVSAVSVPADAGAHIRSAPMPQTRQNVDAPALEPTEEELEVTRIFGPKEKKRLVERAGLDGAFYTRHARKDETAFRSAVLDALVDQDERTAPGPGGEVRSSFDDGDARHQAMTDAIRHRFSPTTKITDQAREYVGLSMPELARRYLQESGQHTRGLGASEVIKRAFHTTSDFPIIMGNAVGMTLREAYSAAPAPLKQLGREIKVPDFRARQYLSMTGAPGLEKINEHGEFESGTMEEAGESYKIDTYGRIIGFARKVLINDQLGALERLPVKFGQQAAAFEAQFLVDLLESNPKMSDGKTLFHADHGNLADTGTPLSVESLDAARKAMRRQTGLSRELISVTPKYLVVSLELETTAEKVLTELQAATVESVNPFSRSLKLIVEPRLSLNNGLAWYLAASSDTDGLEYAYLDGEEQPFLDTRVGFEVDGIEHKVRLDFGGGFIEHRGWYRNNGA